MSEVFRENPQASVVDPAEIFRSDVRQLFSDADIEASNFEQLQLAVEGINNILQENGSAKGLRVLETN